MTEVILPHIQTTVGISKQSPYQPLLSAGAR